MREWGLVAAGALLAGATPAFAAPAGPALHAAERKPAALVGTLGALSATLPSVGVQVPAGLRVTTVVGGPASRERIEGRLETRTKLVFPQIGCWHAWARGFFLGLELGWSVASGAPARGDATEPRREGGGLAGLARPTTSILHLGWSR